MYLEEKRGSAESAETEYRERERDEKQGNPIVFRLNMYRREQPNNIIICKCIV